MSIDEEKEKQKRYGIKLCEVDFIVEGELGLFTDPSTRLNNNKVSYPVPTYEALKGICKSIYWKPSVEWVVDSVEVLNEIQFYDINYNYPTAGTKRQLSKQAYLFKPRYRVKAHLIPTVKYINSSRTADAKDQKKHSNMTMRGLERGGRRMPFLGTKECLALIYPTPDDLESGYYADSKNIIIGEMFFKIDYPELNLVDRSIEKAYRRYFLTTMKNGVIEFPEIRHNETDTQGKGVYTEELINGKDIHIEWGRWEYEAAEELAQKTEEVQVSAIYI